MSKTDILGIAFGVVLVLWLTGDWLLKRWSVRRNSQLIERLRAQRKDIRRQIEGITTELEVWKCSAAQSDRLLMLHMLLAQVDATERELMRAIEQQRGTA